jgi:hypothetical protein
MFRPLLLDLTLSEVVHELIPTHVQKEGEDEEIEE